MLASTPSPYFALHSGHAEQLDKIGGLLEISAYLLLALSWITSEMILENGLKEWESDLCISGGQNIPDRAKQPVKRL